jgi:hypothetical protein
MEKASEYRAHARECRKLATRMVQDKDRDLLLAMAADWERLARDRVDLVRRHPELARPEDQTKEAGAGEAPGRRL